MLTTGDVLIQGNTTDRTHYISSIGTIPGSHINIGAYIVFRIKRIAITGGGSDPSSDPFIIAVGFHAQQNTIGSRGIYTKWQSQKGK